MKTSINEMFRNSIIINDFLINPNTGLIMSCNIVILLDTTANPLTVGRHEGTFHRIDVLLVSPVFVGSPTKI